MNMKIDSRLVVKLRKKKGWSQTELSIASGVSHRTVQRVENEGKASLETLKSLASVFEIEFKELVVQPSKPGNLYKKAAASFILFFSLASAIFITSTTTAASGIEIKANSQLVSSDQTVTFTGDVSMLIPNSVPFEISTIRSNLGSEETPHQLQINTANVTFLVLDSRITKVEKGIRIKASEVQANNVLE